MDLNEFKKELVEARENKKLLLGIKSTRESISLGKAKLVAYAKNSPFISEFKKYGQLSKVEIFPYPEDGLSLGELCKKPFAVSALAVIK